jgi:hypothetical protein
VNGPATKEVDNVETSNAFWREIASDFSLVTFNDVFRNSLQTAKVFRYQTVSGFAFETSNKTLPVFNADDKSVAWYSFEQPSLWDLYLLPQEKVQTLYFGEAGQAEWIGNADAVLTGSELPAIDNFLVESRFNVGTTVEGWIQSACQCFERLENRLVDHNPVRLVLMAGRKYLISRSQREGTEAAADDHTTHLELLTLSRDHSERTSFSAVFRGLREFGWRLWSQLTSRSFSSIFCSPWSRTRSSYCCL